MYKDNVKTPLIEIDPPVYFCPKAKGPLKLDGNIFKPFWYDVPFTEPFVDISGWDYPTPRFQTRAKICWDEENLYVAALLEGDEIWASIKKRDSVIYYDNDFEIFIDPSSSTHNYLEMEMNALNTTWDLLLTQPYRDGGRSVTCWDIKGLETAVHIEGSLNDPSAENLYWSVEVRIPFQSLMETYSKEENPPELERCYPPRTAPRAGEFWRMNFSRVQWTVDTDADGYHRRTDADGKVLPEDNWVWAPTGLIDIHCPEFWSFVFFTEAGEPHAVPEDERKKLALRRVYYAEHRYFAEYGRYSDSLEELDVDAFPYDVTIEKTSRTFLLSTPAEDEGRVYLRDDGYTYVEK